MNRKNIIKNQKIRKYNQLIKSLVKKKFPNGIQKLKNPQYNTNIMINIINMMNIIKN